MEDNLKWKTTSKGRSPKMEDILEWKTTGGQIKVYFYVKLCRKAEMH
jgi:hypothetical protein